MELVRMAFPLCDSTLLLRPRLRGVSKFTPRSLSGVRFSGPTQTLGGRNSVDFDKPLREHQPHLLQGPAQNENTGPPCSEIMENLMMATAEQETLLRVGSFWAPHVTAPRDTNAHSRLGTPVLASTEAHCSVHFSPGTRDSASPGWGLSSHKDPIVGAPAHSGRLFFSPPSWSTC